MFKVSEEASTRIKDFVEGQAGLKSVRILVTEGGWRGPYLVMALDEEKETDEVIVDRGVKFLIDKSLFERVKPISIDYVQSTLGSGYILESELVKGIKGVFAGCRNICDNCEEFGPENSGK